MSQVKPESNPRILNLYTLRPALEMGNSLPKLAYK